MSMPRRPQSTVGKLLFALGALALLFALAMQWQMWLAVFEFTPVAPGGGEYMIALFFGLPSLLLSVLLLGVAQAVARWRSQLAAATLVVAATVLLGWVGLLLRGLAT